MSKRLFVGKRTIFLSAILLLALHVHAEQPLFQDTYAAKITSLLKKCEHETDYQQTVNIVCSLSSVITKKNLLTSQEKSLIRTVNNLVNERDKKSEALLERIITALEKINTKKIVSADNQHYLMNVTKTLILEKTMRSIFKAASFNEKLTLFTRCSTPHILFFDTITQQLYCSCIKHLLNNYEKDITQTSPLATSLSHALQSPLIDAHYAKIITEELIKLDPEKNIRLALEANNFDAKINNLSVLLSHEQAIVITPKVQHSYAQALHDLFTYRILNDPGANKRLIDFYTNIINNSELISLPDKQEIQQYILALKTEHDIKELETAFLAALNTQNIHDSIHQVLQLVLENQSKVLTTSCTSALSKKLMTILAQPLTNNAFVADLYTLTQHIIIRPGIPKSERSLFADEILPLIEAQRIFSAQYTAIIHALTNPDDHALLNEITSALIQSTPYAFPEHIDTALLQALMRIGKTHALELSTLNTIERILTLLLDRINNSTSSTPRKNYDATLTQIRIYKQQAMVYHELDDAIKQQSPAYCIELLSQISTNDQALAVTATVQRMIDEMQKLLITCSNNTLHLDTLLVIAKNMLRHIPHIDQKQITTLQAIIKKIENAIMHNAAVNTLNKTLEIDDAHQLLLDLQGPLTQKLAVSLPIDALHDCVKKLQQLYSENSEDRYIITLIRKNIGHILKQENCDSALTVTLSQQLLPAIAKAQRSIGFHDGLHQALLYENTRTLLRHITTCIKNAPAISINTTTLMRIIKTLKKRTLVNQKNSSLIQDIAACAKLLSEQEHAQDATIVQHLSALTHLLNQLSDGFAWHNTLTTLRTEKEPSLFIEHLMLAIDTNPHHTLTGHDIAIFVDKMVNDIIFDQLSSRTATVLSRLTTYLRNHNQIAETTKNIIDTTLQPNIDHILTINSLHSTVDQAIAQTDYTSMLKTLIAIFEEEKNQDLIDAKHITHIATVLNTIAQSTGHTLSLLQQAEKLCSLLCAQKNTPAQLMRTLKQQIMPALQEPLRLAHCESEIAVFINTLQGDALIEKIRTFLSSYKQKKLSEPIIRTIAEQIEKQINAEEMNSTHISHVLLLTQELLDQPRAPLNLKNKLALEVIPKLQKKLAQLQ